MERRPIWRRDAVRAQIEAAIALFAQGKPIPSLSLAGAAEEATPATNEPYVFEKAKQVGPERGYGTAQEVGQRLNETRNWLKHHDAQKPDPHYFHEVEAIFMILRAATKYQAAYGDDDIEGLAKFRDWLVG
ncbi:hypothetical protein, partial [Methyloceanibacter sp.]|uniref:hypothetical protein n=1 Tax=Methyloceanibacter sp. TaxID=1965321 RepID=UPI002D23CE79